MKSKDHLKKLIKSTKGGVMSASAGINKILSKLQPKIPQKFTRAKGSKKAEFIAPTKMEMKVIEMLS